MGSLDNLRYNHVNKFYVGRPPDKVTAELKKYSVKEFCPLTEFDSEPRLKGEKWYYGGSGKLWMAKTLEDVFEVCPEDSEVFILFGPDVHIIPDKVWKQNKIYLVGLTSFVFPTSLNFDTEDIEWKVETLEIRNLRLRGKHSWNFNIAKKIYLIYDLFESDFQILNCPEVEIFGGIFYKGLLNISDCGSIYTHNNRFYNSELYLCRSASCTIRNCKGC